MDNLISRLCCLLMLTFLLPVSVLAKEAKSLGQVIIEGEVSIYRPFGEKLIDTGIQDLKAHLEPAGGFDGSQNMQLRYKLWTLVGEPVWTFAAKVPELKNITLSRGSNTLLYIKRNPLLPSGAVSWSAGSKQIHVASDVMAKARVYDFSMHLPFDINAFDAPLPEAFRTKSDLDSGSIIAKGFPSIYRPFPGILGVAGEWSWDVPGSPDWGNLFRSPALMFPDFSPASYLKGGYDAETSKAIMRRLLYAHGFLKKDVVSSVYASVGDLKFTLHDLLREIGKQHPNALDTIYGVLSKEDRVLSKIVAAFENDLYKLGNTPAMIAEARKIDQLVREFQNKLSPSITSIWRNVMKSANELKVEESSNKVIGDVAQIFQRSSGLSAEQIDKDILKSIRAASAKVDAVTAQDSRFTSRKLEIKRSLNLLQMHSQGLGPEDTWEPYEDSRTGKYGFKDQEGKVVISPNFDRAHRFVNGFAWVYDRRDESTYYINAQGKRTFGPFQDGEDFSQGLAVVRTGSKTYRYLKTDGSLMGSYSKARTFHESGFAAVRHKNDQRGSWGIINTQGRVIVPLEYLGSHIKDSNSGDAEFVMVVDISEKGKCNNHVYEEYSQRFNTEGRSISGRELYKREVGGQICLRGRSY